MKKRTVSLVCEPPVKYDSKAKKTSSPQKVWEATWEYVAERAGKTVRTPQEQMEIMKQLDEVIVAHFGTDDPAFIEAELARLKKRAEGK